MNLFLISLLLTSLLEQSQTSVMLICAETSAPPVLSAWDYFSGESSKVDELSSIVDERIEIREDEVVHHPAQKWILILKEYRSLLLCEADSVLFNYPCSVGDEQRGKQTPAGWYRIINKIEDPVMVWESGDVVPAGDWRNSFGNRWMGLGDWSTGRVTDYGIHGTNSPEAIGREISLGCVRMYNWDAQTVFEQLDVGALVVIK